VDIEKFYCKTEPMDKNS
jgi:hypothetical protein